MEENDIYKLHAPQDETAETEVDRAIKDKDGNVIDATYAKIDDVQTALEEKADIDDVQAALAEKANIDDVYDKTTIDGLLNGKQDVIQITAQDANKVLTANSTGTGFVWSDNTHVSYSLTISSSSTATATIWLIGSDGSRSTVSGILTYDYLPVLKNSDGIGIGRNAQVGSQSIAFGYDARATGSTSEAIGYSSRSTGTCSTAIGHEAVSQATESVAIGCYAKAYIPYSVSFDNTDSSHQRTIGLYDPSHIFFRYANVNSSYTSWSQYPNGKSLADLLKTDGYGNDIYSTYAASLAVSGNTVSAPLTITLRSNYGTSLSIISGILTTTYLPISKYSGTGLGIGLNASVSNDFTTAIGNDASASGAESTAIGYNAHANGFQTFAIGNDATTSSTASGSTAIGNGASATAKYCGAFGDYSCANAFGAFALAHRAKTSIPLTVIFDGHYDGALYNRTFLFKNPSQIFFTAEDRSDTNEAYTSLSQYDNGKTLQQFLDDKQNSLTTSSVNAGTASGVIAFDANGNLIRDVNLTSSYLEKSTTNIAYSQSSQGLTIKSKTNVSGGYYPVVSATLYTVNDAYVTIGGSNSNDVLLHGARIYADKIEYKGKTDSSFTTLNYSDVATKTYVDDAIQAAITAAINGSY